MSSNDFVEIEEQENGDFILRVKGIEDGAGEGREIGRAVDLRTAIKLAQEVDIEYGYDVEWLTP